MYSYIFGSSSSATCPPVPSCKVSFDGFSVFADVDNFFTVGFGVIICFGVVGFFDEILIVATGGGGGGGGGVVVVVLFRTCVVVVVVFGGIADP